MRFERLALAGFVLLLAGCQRETVTSYSTPKEDHTVRVTSASASGGATSSGRSELPHVHWDLPAGWTEKTGEQRMGVGSFRIEGDGADKFADVRIIPLRFGDGIEDRSVNMWRGELGLEELPEGHAKGESVEVGDLKGNLYDMASTEPKWQEKFPARTTAVILNREGVLWFFKMMGESSLVAKQQEAFRNFLKSIQFHEGSHDHSSDAEPAVVDNGKNWKAPTGWKLEGPRQMVLATYTAAHGDGSAEIAVSSFPGDVGGLLANANRWRGQIGLEPIAAGDLEKEVKSIHLAGGEKASVVDATGTNPKTGKAGRLYGLIVPRGGNTWFYKMVGDSAAVEAETKNLADFAAIAK